jgi:hypothetical protein
VATPYRVLESLSTSKVLVQQILTRLMDDSYEALAITNSP